MVLQDGSEPPPALQAVVRRELRRLGAPRLLADCVRELRLQQADEQGEEGRAQEEWERAHGPQRVMVACFPERER